MLAQADKSDVTAQAPPSPSVTPIIPSPSVTPIVPSPSVTPTVPSPSVTPTVPSPSVTPTVPSPSVSPVVPSPSPSPGHKTPPPAGSGVKPILTVPSQFQGKIIRMVKLPKQQKVVALTFDDGPWTSTLEILDILKKNKIKATFFMVGKHLQLYPEIAKKVAAAGHTIGNHTWSHLYKPMEQTQVVAEIDNTTASIFKKTGTKAVFFRPPGGELKNGQAAYAAEKKYVITMWSVSPGDAKPKVSAQQIVNDVVKNTRSGSIILLHDGGGDRSATVQALPLILKELSTKGYKFVSLFELLRIPGAKAVSGY